MCLGKKPIRTNTQGFFLYTSQPATQHVLAGSGNRVQALVKTLFQN